MNIEISGIARAVDKRINGQDTERSEKR